MKKILALALAVPFMVHAQAANQAVLTFTIPTLRSDGTSIPAAAISYNIYQGLKGQAKTKVGTVTTNTTTLTTGLLSNTQYCWQVTAFETAVGASSESVMSNEGCKTMPAAAVGTVTLTVQ